MTDLRKVFCVSVCRDVSTDTLQAMVSIGETLGDQFSQRDELLAALKEARSYVIELCGSLHIPLPEASMERFNAAIAKAGS